MKDPKKSTEETVSSESDRGEFSYLIQFGGGGGEGPQQEAPTGRFQREEEKEAFLTLLFNYLLIFLSEAFHQGLHLASLNAK